MSEIQNELQRKMVEEIQCVVCSQFPYKPKECNKCNKLFCKYCQLQLASEAQLDNRGRTVNSECSCPNCGTKGDFLQEVNKLLKNCIDFCEFPHKCIDSNGQPFIMWKTLVEL